MTNDSNNLGYIPSDSIESLEWTNLFIHTNNSVHPMYTPKNKTSNSNNHIQNPVPKEMRESVEKILSEVDKIAQKKLEDLKKINPHASQWDIQPFYCITEENFTARVTPVQTLKGTQYILRRLSNLVIDQNDLDVPEPYLDRIDNWLQKPGLTLIGGRFATRKTTHCYSYLKAYLKKYGGIGFIVDSPAEIDFSQETFPRAHCIQVDINENPNKKTRWEQITNIIRKSSATIIYGGEISDPDSASFLLQQAHTGRPVFANLHGESIPTIIENLASFAEKAGVKDPKEILANCLVGITCQTVENNMPRMEVLQISNPHEIGGSITEEDLRAAISSGTEESYEKITKTQIEQTQFLEKGSSL